MPLRSRAMRRTYRNKQALSPPLESNKSMAALADSLADDFNNILTVILGACSLIDCDSKSPPELSVCVALIRTSAEHAASLSNRLVQMCTVRKHHKHSKRLKKSAG